MVTRRRNMRKPEQNPSPPERDVEKVRECKDISGILLLIGLYILQGIPLGLASAVPFLLQSDEHTASYRYQAIFSWVFWPFSLKFAWAPFVDALYFPRLGRRKTWLLPVQYALGIDFCVLGGYVDRWLGRRKGESWGPLGVAGAVQIWPLTAAFFGLTLLAATQDIVVDGWALTMLSAENVGWASTCNSVGQSIGYILGFIVFLALESPSVCNSYLRSVPVPDKGIVSFSGFLYICGVVFIVSTTLVALFKREKEDKTSAEAVQPSRQPRQSSDMFGDSIEDESQRPLLPTENGELEILPQMMVMEGIAEPAKTGKSKYLSIWQTYRVMLRILRLRPVIRYIAFVFIVKFVFSASDSVFGLKMLEHGVSKEQMALIGSAVLPLQALLPICVTYWSNGPRPLGVYLNAAIPRALVSLSAVFIVYYVDYFRIAPIETLSHLKNATTTSTTTTFSTTFYIILVTQLIVYAVFAHTMFVCQVAFHARVADPSIGGTYMTLLNTAANLAAALPSTLMLFLVDPLTWRSCDNASTKKAMSVVMSTNNYTDLLDTKQASLQHLAEGFLMSNATCKGLPGAEACQMVGGTCRTIVDGFYIEVGFCLLVGLVSYFTILRRMASTLDAAPLSAYRFQGKSTTSDDHVTVART
ncbi:Acetyl-coenzyme A transporter 1 [Taenia crassiceps]|uniref:Acetyl-coenzyme A transporter 1 n=1 Tax=Taenia crassiceps TaxID=6207 RepID=A0ABR4Q2A2_9CEST